MPVGWEYATRIDAESPCYTSGSGSITRAATAPAATAATATDTATGTEKEANRAIEENLQRQDPPAGWLRSRSGVWEGWTPPAWVPRLQGWKIHVSTTRADAVAVLDSVTAVCVAQEVAFKYLPTLADLWAANAKHADRASAGKFVTIYPRDDDQLAILLTALGTALAGKTGPYILSDLRVGDAPVFVRYGGIYPLTYRDAEDTQIAALATGPELRLSEDLRRPTFTIPDGVALPPCLDAAWKRHRQDVASPIDDYARIEALGFSNAGGVYLATHRDGRRHVLREARPHAGWDARGRTAIERQLHEERVLSDLRGVPGVQQLVGSFTAWEHRFLVLDYLEGAPVVKWAATHYPLHYVDRPDDRAAIAGYAATAAGVVDQLTAIIEQVHARGWCVGDLHPGNVLIDDAGRVGLLDLEDATPIDALRDIGMRVIEYCAPEDRTAREADWYAAARIAMNLYVTGWPVEVICPGSWERHLDLVRARMGQRAAAQIQQLCRRAGDHLGPDRPRHMLSPRLVADPAPRPPQSLGAVVDGLVAFTDWSMRYGEAGGYPGDPVLGGRLPWASWEAGLAGVVFARARIDHPVSDHVAQRLATATAVLDREGPIDLHHGLAGMALALHEHGRGYQDRAAAVLATCLDRVEEIRRRDLAHGRAGVLLAALEVAYAGDHGALRQAALRGYQRFVAHASPVHAAKPGLHFGESGIALLDLMVARRTGSQAALLRGLQRIRRDAEQCELTADGTCLVTDAEGGRLLPYLEWGSAGVLAAATVAGRLGLDRVLGAEITAGIRHACSSRMYVYDGFHHGRAGILATLLAAGADDSAAFQAGHLAVNLPRIAGTRCVVGDGLIRLSADLATGAAGVALVLDCAARDRPFAWLPIARDSAADLAGGPADDLDAERTVVPDTADGARHAPAVPIPA